MNKVNKVFLALGIMILPVVAMAQGVGGVSEVLADITSLLNQIIPFIIGLAVLYFLFGILKYITAGSESEGRKEAINMIIWGLVFIFVMVSVWGLVNILVGTFDLDNSIPDVPEVVG